MEDSGFELIEEREEEITRLRGVGAQRSGVYVASKVKHAEMWKRLRSHRPWHGQEITATWIDEAGEGQTSDHAELAARCLREVAKSKAVILYCEPGDVLKGALIEVGAALALGIPVYCVGTCESLSTRTFSKHPLWHESLTVNEAIGAILHAKLTEAKPEAPAYACEAMDSSCPQGICTRAAESQHEGIDGVSRWLCAFHLTACVTKPEAPAPVAESQETLRITAPATECPCRVALEVWKRSAEDGEEWEAIHRAEASSCPCEGLRDGIESALPATYYADLPLAARVGMIARQWNRAIGVNQTLETELAAANERADTEQMAREELSDRLGEANERAKQLSQRVDLEWKINQELQLRMASYGVQLDKARKELGEAVEMLKQQPQYHWFRDLHRRTCEADCHVCAAAALVARFDARGGTR